MLCLFRKDTTIKFIVNDIDTITNKTEIAETLATLFAAKSLPDQYREKFRRIRDREKEKTLDFESDNDEKYNMLLFQNDEIDYETGNELHYQFLKHLPDVSIELLLLLLNNHIIISSLLK